MHILLLKYAQQPRKATPKEKLEEEYKKTNRKTQSRSENASEQMHTTDSDPGSARTTSEFKWRAWHSKVLTTSLRGMPWIVL